MINIARQPPRSSRFSRGFTVLEALVVLIITGLLTLVLVQGLGVVLAGRATVANKILDLDQVVLERNLLLDPLRGVVPDYEPSRGGVLDSKERFVFKGDARNITALTIRPLGAMFGVPTGFRMYFAFDSSVNQTALMYQEGTRAAQELTRWPGDVGTFAYHDRDGAWQPAWPAPQTQLNFQGLQSRPPQTPWLIRLDTGQGFPPTLVAYVAGSHERTMRMQDMPFGGTLER